MFKYIGIDISKKDFHVCMEENGDVLKFLNTPSGIRKFIKHLQKKDFLIKNTIIGLESTGSYHLPVSYICTEAGYMVRVINALIVKRYNQKSLRRVKTDPHDARLIRFCTAEGEGNVFCDTADTLTLKTLVRQRARLSMLRHRIRLRGEEVSHRESYLKCHITDVNDELFAFLDEKIKALDKELKTYSSDLQKLLMSIPGVGPQTAVTCISELGSISRFPNPNTVVAYVGLDSRVHQSGTSVNGKGYISKRGNKLLRTRLYNAASVAVLHENMFQEFFLKKRSEGKPYRVALCAVMRKMVHVIYAVWTRETPFA